MDIHTSNKWTGKVKLNVVEREYSPKRIIQLPVACQLPKGEYFIAISANETMDIPNINQAGKQLFKIFDTHFREFKKFLSQEERQSMDKIEEALKDG